MFVHRHFKQCAKRKKSNIFFIFLYFIKTFFETEVLHFVRFSIQTPYNQFDLLEQIAIHKYHLEDSKQYSQIEFDI